MQWQQLKVYEVATIMNGDESAKIMNIYTAVMIMRGYTEEKITIEV